jgi:hypothetical protein
MFERLSRFATRPGDIKIPARSFYPSKPVVLMTRWCVRMVCEDLSGEVLPEPWHLESHVFAITSMDAVARARAQFYEGWASYADRQRMPLRILEVLQEAV